MSVDPDPPNKSKTTSPAFDELPIRNLCPNEQPRLVDIKASDTIGRPHFLDDATDDAAES